MNKGERFLSREMGRKVGKREEKLGEEQIILMIFTKDLQKLMKMSLIGVISKKTETTDSIQQGLNFLATTNCILPCSCCLVSIILGMCYVGHCSKRSQQ